MAMKVRLFLSLVILASLLLWFAGCGHYVCHTTFGSSTCSPTTGGIGGGGGGGGGVSALVYFMDDQAGQIAAEGLNLNGSGTFAPVPGFVSPTLPAPPIGDGGLVIVNKTYLYMPLANGLLYAFSIDGTTGALTPLTTPTYQVAGSSIAADPMGRFIFVGSGAGITVMTVASSGALTAVTGSPFSTGTVSATQLSTDGLGKYVFVADGSEVAGFSYNQTTGALTAVTGNPFAFNMLQMSGESSGKFMLGVTGQTNTGSALDDNVYLFSISSTGTLSLVSKFGTVNPPAYVTSMPTGEFVYAFTQETTATNTVLDPIEGFQLLPAGVLQTLVSSPFTNFLGQIGHFEQTGQFLFMKGETTNSQAQGSVALSVSSTTGVLGNTLPGAGAPSASFAVTDAP